jgi:hypothetical protein
MGGMHSEVGHANVLLASSANAQAFGRIQWSSRGSARVGKVPVRAQGLLDPESARLEFTVSVLRPTEPKVAYLADGAAIRRLCVNVEHRPYSGTHKHRVSGDPAGDAYEPSDIPALELDAEPPPNAHREILEAFAAECCIDIGDLEWVDP